MLFISVTRYQIHANSILIFIQIATALSVAMHACSWRHLLRHVALIWKFFDVPFLFWNKILAKRLHFGYVGLRRVTSCHISWQNKNIAILCTWNARKKSVTFPSVILTLTIKMRYCSWTEVERKDKEISWQIDVTLMFMTMMGDNYMYFLFLV